MTHKYSAALTVLLACASPAVFAATSHTATNPPGITIQSDQLRAHKMIGASVYDRNNQKIGSVQDIVLNKGGTVADVVVDVGRFLHMGGKFVAVKFGDIKTDNNRLTLDLTKEQLQQMAAYNLTNKSTGAGTTESTVHGGKLGSGSSLPPRR
jgi:sporulation protein YlmC with PRC-barrel domain